MCICKSRTLKEIDSETLAASIILITSSRVVYFFNLLKFLIIIYIFVYITQVRMPNDWLMITFRSVKRGGRPLTSNKTHLQFMRHTYSLYLQVAHLFSVLLFKIPSTTFFSSVLNQNTFDAVSFPLKAVTVAGTVISVVTASGSARCHAQQQIKARIERKYWWINQTFRGLFH